MCIVQVNDESDGESRYLHPHTNESDTDDLSRSGRRHYTVKMELPT